MKSKIINCPFCGIETENVFTCDECWDFYDLEAIYDRIVRKPGQRETEDQLQEVIKNIIRKEKLEAL